jgi:septal ring factor EnvC (AmiA/AmiB activator)
MAIDTLELAKTLAGPDGFTQRQAELLARTLHQVEDSRLAGVDGRLKAIEGRLDKIDTKVEAMEGQLDKIDTKVEVMEGRLGKLETKVSTQTAILALVVMFLGGGIWQLVTINRSLGQLEASVAMLVKR